MKYLDKSFSSPHNSKKYRDNFDVVFGKKDDKNQEKKKPSSPKKK